MEKDKATMRDIAQACGISVATVSYVLNHSEKEKISHETRLKVLETATRLHYEPHSVRTLGQTKSGLIGVIVTLKETNTVGKKMMYYDLAAELSTRLRAMGYETILISTTDLSQDFGLVKKHSMDAVFMIDVDNRTVRRVTEGYYVPILFLDCMVRDPLFCEIHPDYNALFAQAKNLLDCEHLFLLTEDFRCQDLMECFMEHFLPRDIFVNTGSLADLGVFLQNHRGQKGLVLGDLLGMQALNLFPARSLAILSALSNAGVFREDAQIFRISNAATAAAATKILQDMLSLDYRADDTNCILMNSECP